MGIFCNIIFTVTFNKYNTFLLNNSINFHQKAYFLCILYKHIYMSILLFVSYRNDQYLINTRGVAYTATA